MTVLSPGDRSKFWAGLWRLADPKISLASFSAMFLGACAARADGPLSWGWLALTVLGIFFVEVAKNASGEVVDFDSGADLGVAPEDRSPFSGGKRVLVDGLLTRRQTMLISAASYAGGIAVGLVIVEYREPRVLWLGLIGVGCAYFYHAAPLRLSYRGLGELAVGLCYGPLITTGTYLVQRGAIARHVVLASGLLGLLISGFLWVNEFPDYPADRASGKRNLVVRLGRVRAARSFVVLVGIAAAGFAFLPGAGVRMTVWLGSISLLPAAAAAAIVVRHALVTPRLIRAQALMLLSFVLFALGSGVGFILDGRPGS